MWRAKIESNAAERSQNKQREQMEGETELHLNLIQFNSIQLPEAETDTFPLNQNYSFLIHKCLHFKAPNYPPPSQFQP